VVCCWRSGGIMTILAIIIASTSSGSVAPPKPNITRPSEGTFVIQNYNSQYSYTRSDGVAVTSNTIILSNVNSSCTVTSSNQKI
jgi:hypothetical protein